jgi:hypothetical protein
MMTNYVGEGPKLVVRIKSWVGMALAPSCLGGDRVIDVDFLSEKVKTVDPAVPEAAGR